MNKKGNISITLTLLAGIVLTGVALYTYASYNNNINEEATILSRTTSELNFNEKYMLEKTKLIMGESIIFCQECNPEKLKEQIKTTFKQRNLKIKNMGNLPGKIRNSDFTINKNKNYQISISNLTAFSINEGNKLSLKFSLCQTFSSKGEFISDC